MSKITRREFFKQRIPIYRANAVIFAEEVLRFNPDEWQGNVLEDISHHNLITVRSGQGVGKTGVEAIALLWFLSCFPYPRIVATAPTRQQLHDVLWSEIAKWQSKSPLLSEILTWTKTYIYMKGYEKRWFAVARTATKPENMQGFHEDNMLFIVDEASGVRDEIMEAILGTLSGDNNKLLMCGNPTKTSGVFYDSHTRDRQDYCVHRVNAEDSPRTNKKNIATLKRKYGADSNFVRVRVEGEFPLQEDDVFIPLYLIEAAVNNEVEIDTIKRISFGVDVARYGNDETVIAKNVNGIITMPIKRRGQNLMKTVGEIVAQYNEAIQEYPKYIGKIYIIIDDTGLGGGVTDRLEEVKIEQKLTRMVIIPVNFAGKIEDEEGAKYFADLATYMWDRVREMMLNSLLRLDGDDELAAQFSSRKYEMTSSGKMKLEGKKDMKKRSLPSPDRAEAVALSCYSIDAPRATLGEIGDALDKDSYWSG